MPYRSLTALGVTAVLMGCMPGTGTPFGAAQPSGPPEYIFPALAEVQAENVPPELKAVAGATVRRLLGQSASSVRRDIGVRNAGLIRPSKDMPLKGYAVREVQYLGAYHAADNTDDREAAFNLLFVDGYGRDAAVRAVVGYTKARGGIQMTRAKWTPVTLPAPHFDTFVVPADQTKRMLRAARSWRGLYDEATKRAIPRSAMATQLAQGGEFLVISLGKRPIGQGAKVTLELAEAADAPSLVAPDAIRRLGYPGGYVAMVAPVGITSGDAVWGRILHTAGAQADAAARKPVVVEQFQLGGQPSG